MIKNISLLALAAALAAPAMAADTTRFYVTSDFGQTDFRVTNIDLGNLVPADSAANAVNIKHASSKDNGLSLRFGYRIDDTFSIEAGYTNLGKTDFTAQRVKSTTYLGPMWSGELKASAYELNLVAEFEIADKWTAYGKLGAAQGKVKTELSSSAGGISRSQGSTTALFGGGVNYNITKNIGAHLEWTRHQGLGASTTTGKADVNMFALGATFKF